MNSKDEQVRAAIAEQASEWLVAGKELNASDSAAFVAWLKTSPLHVEEFLGVSALARDLKEARGDPEYSLEAILARERAEDNSRVQSILSPVSATGRQDPSRRWLIVSLTVAACAALTVGFFLAWNTRPTAHGSSPSGLTASYFTTGHGEQSTHRLADNSVVHLNTDSAVSITYRKTERLVTLTSGQAEFEVAHEPDREFRVIAGSAQIIDRGTQFDVRLEQDAAVVTVIEGKVAVGSAQNHTPRLVRLIADQQIRIQDTGELGAPMAVDARNATAWLRREIVFDHETLERVAAEYNRYTTKPFEIATPALRSLQISGVFATDDTEAFIAFLRSLKGVRVEVTENRIRVFQD